MLAADVRVGVGDTDCCANLESFYFYYMSLWFRVHKLDISMVVCSFIQ